MSEKKIELFKDYHCRKCGSANVDVFESESKICFKCDDCNERFIFSKDERKQGAVDFANEVKQYLMERINRPNTRVDIWSAEITKWYVEDLKILENRLKELKEGVEK
jgi:hypothetical protein